MCSHLEEFIAPTCFSVEDDGEGATFRGTTVRYAVPKSLVFDLESGAVQLKIAQKLWRSEEKAGTVISLVARHMISLSPSTPQSVEWYLERIWRTCHLLTLLTEEVVLPEKILVKSCDERQSHLLLYRRAAAREGDDKSAGILLLYLDHVAERFGEILSRWHSASATLTSAMHLFIDAQQQRSSSEGRFLTLSLAFEAFSRATTASEYMLATEYDVVKAQIIASIPSTVSSDHRESLKARIKYGNGLSLRKRLTQAIESLPPEAIDCVCKSPKAFVSGVVDTRNYLTHYSDELRQSALQGTALHWTSERLAMLLRILLCSELGIDMATIVLSIRKHPRLLQLRHLFMKQPEKA